VTDVTTPGGGNEAATRAVEDAAFHHEAALNTAWTGARLAIGGLTFLFGAFAFAYFYLQAANSGGKWLPPTTTPPHQWYGALIMALVVASAVVQTAGLQQIKAGRKAPWAWAALAALVLGLAAVGLQIAELLHLPFLPGASGYASVFTSFYPVALFSWFCAMIWLEILYMQARSIPAIFFVEQPPTYTEAFRVQRFQASLSSFTLIWNYLAVITFIFWAFFYIR
jgi:heme/copper-type cytochrome/quinol oxidase subunit 3